MRRIPGALLPALPMTNTYNGLSQCIRQLPCRHVVRLIAVDGRAGAGKTTFATRLANALGHVPIIALDDFLAWDDLVDFLATP